MFKMNPLIQFAGIPVSGSEVKSCFSDMASPEKKIQSLERNGELIRLKRNLFIVNPDLAMKETLPELCANHLYGPSYVSLQWALRYYGMILERVYTVTSVTTKRSRQFSTPIGKFSFMQVSPRYFPVGVECREESGVSFLMASREKALCDTILYDAFVPRQSLKGLRIYLEEDMRLDMDVLPELDTAIIEKCAETGPKSQTMLNLIKLIKS